MQKLFLPALFAAAFIACSSDGGATQASLSSASTSTSSGTAEFVPVPVDYSAGRAMNARLGRGINLGNSWDSGDSTGAPDWFNFGFGVDLDDGWGNPIDDGDFKLLKDAGFNSIRLPVRWQQNSNILTHEINAERMAGVIQDVNLAIEAGLAVIMDFHWYKEIEEAAKMYPTDPSLWAMHKEHFLALWAQVASVFNNYPDSLLAFDIYNEPAMKAELMNDLLLSAYQVIRAAAPNKTIIFQSNQMAKFHQIGELRLPQDGNIIFSGHYYEPYTFSHEGHGYKCVGDNSYANTAKQDFTKYVALATQYYPDVNGGHIPMNMGEFGIAAGSRSSCGSDGPSDLRWALWNKKTVAAAEEAGFSWHYWGFTKVGGFEAYDRENAKWYPGAREAFFQN